MTGRRLRAPTWLVLLLLCCGVTRPLSAQLTNLLGGQDAGEEQPASTPPAQEAPAGPPPGPVPGELTELTEEWVVARLAAVTADATLDEAGRATLVDLWTQALGQVRQLKATKEAAAEFVRRRDEAPAELAARKAELASEPVAEPLPPAEAPLADLESALSVAEASVREREAKVSALSAERAQRSQRRTDIPRQAAAARERLAGLAEPSGDPATDDRPAAARRALVQLTRATLQAEIDGYDRERESYDARTELLAAREDLASRQVAVARQRAESLRALVTAAREQARRAAEAQAEAARAEAASAHPARAEMLESRAALLEQASRATAEAQASRKQADKVTQRRDELVRNREALLTKVGKVGLTAGVASKLRRERASLPDEEPVRRALGEHGQALDQATLALDELEQLREALSDQEGYVDALLVQHGRPADAREAEELRARLLGEADELRKQTDLTVRALSEAYEARVTLETGQVQLLNELEDYRRYLDENALWIRNAQPVGAGDLGAGALELREWLDSERGARLVQDLGDELLEHPGRVAVALVALLALFGLRPRARRALAALAERAGNERIVSPTVLLKAGAWTLLLASGLPILLSLVGVVLVDSLDRLVSAVGDGFAWAALGWWPATLLGASCQARGLAQAHLRWSEVVCRRLRRVLPLAGLLISLLVGLSRVLEGGVSGDAGSALARLALSGALLTLAVTPVSLLRPGGAILRDLMARRPNDRGVRLLPLVMVAAALTPLGLLGLLLTGYQEAAAQLTRELLSSWALVAVLVMLYGVASRWLVNERRRSRLEAARQAREAASADGESTASPLEIEASLATAPDHDLVDAQARRLLAVGTFSALLLGLWLIWSDTLPAFAPLQRYALWSVTALGEDGIGTILEVTLQDLLHGLVVLVLTVIAARNLPGLMDVFVFRQLGLEASMAYALSTVLRYLVTGVGLIWALAAIQLQWDQLQWLVAAMGLGLGFGLQEIFGNFVSGLILLFEQRIRVGDVVTVGSVSGLVLRIRVLATTVRDWDRKEYVVPNKDLVTGTLLNWTLSDTVNRIKVDVGVAYGSPTERARELLIEVARKEPNVLVEPPPIATFESFGDSSLGLSLRCFIVGLDDRLATITRLHEAIDAAFQEAGIEIAFPQQDLHIRSWDRDAAPPGDGQG